MYTIVYISCWGSLYFLPKQEKMGEKREGEWDKTVTLLGGECRLDKVGS